MRALRALYATTALHALRSLRATTATTIRLPITPNDTPASYVAVAPSRTNTPSTADLPGRVVSARDLDKQAAGRIKRQRALRGDHQGPAHGGQGFQCLPWFFVHQENPHIHKNLIDIRVLWNYHLT